MIEDLAKKISFTFFMHVNAREGHRMCYRNEDFNIICEIFTPLKNEKFEKANKPIFYIDKPNSSIYNGQQLQ